MAYRAAACVGRRSTALISSPHLNVSFPFPSPRRISFPLHPPAFKHQICRMHKEATLDREVLSKEDDPLSKNWKIKMLYDGECPLCMREVNMLKERNKLYGAIKFVDISSNEYSVEENEGLDYKTVMGRIHAILSDGTVVRDVEAFRRLYEEVGLGWVYAITKYEPVATIASAVYGVWAQYRLQITGRPSLGDILEARKKNKGKVCNDDNACKM
ncbi:putative thiol-disulfide oxidoreductase DCC [Tasmannia lanceolata]|uniref:putative thiol-disulfide oxidoreductase DCC n=1 Tax=Tasmannia lanceolata TaxID=3420 RepID=UPI00406305A4